MNHENHEPGREGPDRRNGHEPEESRHESAEARHESAESADRRHESADRRESADRWESLDRPEAGDRRESLDGPASEDPLARLFSELDDADHGHADLDDANHDDAGEEALRRLLRGAVEDIEPSPDALEHLRRAVPARRARRRQALVGAVAAVVLAGVSLPALVHVATRSGGTDHPANAASSHRTPDTQGGQHGEGSGGKDSGHQSGHGDKGKGGKDDGKKDDTGKGDEGDTGGQGPDPSGSLEITSPDCTRVQLGNSSAFAQPADGEGRIYGTFRVANVSQDTCMVEGSGLVGASAQGGADATRLNVVDHTAGDAAVGLPDPSTQPSSIVLKPGEAYEIKFAWIPAAGGGPSGCSNTGSSPTPDPPTGDNPQDGEPTGGSGGGEQPTGSVALSYTPESGGPTAASTTLPDACAGTVYRTGLLSAS